MGILLAFVVGWAVGAKAGPAEFEEVVAAAKTVRDSEEFTALLAVVRQHVGSSLGALGKVVTGETPLPELSSVVEQVQRLTVRAPR